MGVSLRYFIKFICISTCCIIAFNAYAQQNESKQSVLQTKLDSLRRLSPPLQGLDKVYAYYPLMGDLITAEKEETLAFYNEYEAIILEEQKNEKNSDLKQKYYIDYATVRYNHCIDLYNYCEFEELEKTALHLMELCMEHEFWERYYRTSNLLFESYIFTKKYERAQREISKLYDIAKEKNHISGMMEASYSLGRVYFKQYRYEDAEKYALECIKLSNKVVFKDVCYQVYEAQLLYIEALVKQKKIAQILPAIQQFELIIKDLEQLEKNNNATTPIHQIRLNILYGTYYILTKEYDKADDYRKKLTEIFEINICDATGIPSNYYLLYAQILEGKGKNDEAMNMLQKAKDALLEEDIEQNDEMMFDLLFLNARLNIKTGNTDEGIALYDSIFNTFLKVRNSEFNNQIDELRTIYETDKIIAEKERNRNYFLFALGGCILLAIALGIWIYHNRTVVKKNRGLYRQIKEQDRLAEELEAMTKQYEQIHDTIVQTGRAPSLPDAVCAPSSDDNVMADDVETLRVPSLPDDREMADDVQTGRAPSLPGTHQQRQLISRFKDLLLKNNIFLDYDFDIQKVIPELATNRTSLFEALKAVTDKTPMEYIYHLRLDEAKRLLENTDLTIEHIADESGFRTTRTLYKMFRERFRISPTEYRKIAKLDG
jgi:AraC-like DNA-binding protein